MVEADTEAGSRGGEADEAYLPESFKGNRNLFR